MDIVAPEIERYALEHTTPEPGHLAALAADTRERFESHVMMVGQLEGRFLKLLVRLVQPRLILEIGTYTGYSALSMAEALPSGGRIVTCDVSEEHVAVARRHIDASPYADRIQIRMGPALDTIAGLDGPFDLVFIDADKPNYSNYYDAVVPKLSEGGLIAADNVLWSGNVVDPAAHSDDNTTALVAFADKVRADPRVECVMVPLRDGLLLVNKVS